MRLSGSWQQTQCTAELSLRPILMSGGSLNYYITVFNSYCSHKCILYFLSLKVTGVHAWCFPSASLNGVVSDLLGGMANGGMIDIEDTFLTVYISKLGKSCIQRQLTWQKGKIGRGRDGQKLWLLAWVVGPGWVQCRCGVGGDLTIYWAAVAALCSFRADKSWLPGSCSPAVVHLKYSLQYKPRFTGDNGSIVEVGPHFQLTI